MLGRKRTGSVICTSCGVLVGVNDDKCYNCGRRNPGLWGFAPVLRSLGNDLGFIPFVIGGCVIVYMLTLVSSGGILGSGGMLSLLGPDPRALLLFGASGAYPVFGFQRWWTVLSAAWLHAGLLHILFNMMSVRQLAPPTVDFYGPARTFIIYIAGAIVGFTLSSVAGAYFPGILRGSQVTVGASASICGLIGALLYYGHRTGSSLVRSEATRFIIMLAIYGFIMPRIDNWAHAGGVGGGYLAGMLMDPLKPERGDHVLIAIVLAVLSIASIVVSVVTAS